MVKVSLGRGVGLGERESRGWELLEDAEQWSYVKWYNFQRHVYPSTFLIIPPFTAIFLIYLSSSHSLPQRVSTPAYPPYPYFSTHTHTLYSLYTPPISPYYTLFVSHSSGRACSGLHHYSRHFSPYLPVTLFISNSFLLYFTSFTHTISLSPLPLPYLTSF